MTDTASRLLDTLVNIDDKNFLSVDVIANANASQYHALFARSVANTEAFGEDHVALLEAQELGIDPGDVSTIED